MSKPKPKRHRWVWWPARNPTRAGCDCGAKLVYERPYGRRVGFTRYITVTVYLSPTGERIVNPRPMPPCGRK